MTTDNKEIDDDGFVVCEHCGKGGGSHSSDDCKENIDNYMTDYQCCLCKQFFTDEPKRLDAFVFCQKCHETKKNEFKKAFMERFQKLDEEIHKMHTDLVLFMTQNNIECVQ